jgi:hypothetical protein
MCTSDSKRICIFCRDTQPCIESSRIRLCRGLSQATSKELNHGKGTTKFRLRADWTISERRTWKTGGSLSSIAHLLPPLPLDSILAFLAEGRPGLYLWPVAVEFAGKRSPDQPILDAKLASAIADADSREQHLVPILDHAGPQAVHWMSARAYGPAAVKIPSSGRTPQALDANGWADRVKAYDLAAQYLSEARVPRALLGIHDSGLLASAISPMGYPGQSEAQRWEMPLHVFRKVKAVLNQLDVLLVVEEICPGGLDPMDGISFSLRLEKEGAGGIWATGGSDYFPAARQRFEVRDQDCGDPWLTSAAWLTEKVQIPIWAVGQTKDSKMTLARAEQMGLTGIAVLTSIDLLVTERTGGE